jgi:hypothetical protein
VGKTKFRVCLVGLVKTVTAISLASTLDRHFPHHFLDGRPRARSVSTSSVRFLAAQQECIDITICRNS